MDVYSPELHAPLNQVVVPRISTSPRTLAKLLLESMGYSVGRKPQKQELVRKGSVLIP